MNNMWLPLKIILLPRTITSRDLYRLLEELDFKIENTDLETINTYQKINKKLAALVFHFLKPIIISKRTSIIIRRENLERWFKLETALMRLLLENNHMYEARVAAISFIREYIFLLSLYIIIGDIFENKKRIVRGKFDEDALLFLLDKANDPELLDILEALDLKLDFQLAIQVYFLSMEETLRSAFKETNASKAFLSILSKYKKNEDYLLGLIKVAQENQDKRARLVDNLIFLVSIFTRKYLVTGGQPSILSELLDILNTSISEQPKYQDILWRILNDAISVLKTKPLNPQVIVEKLENLGLSILNQKLIHGNFNERVFLRIPPEARLLFMPPLMSPINLKDIYITVSVDFVINETLQAFTGPILELQNIFSLILTQPQDAIEKTINAILDSPLASYGASFILGSIGSWLVDNTIAIIFAHEANEASINKILNLTFMYFNNLYKETKKLLETTDTPYIRKFLTYPLFRETYFASSKITSEVLSKLRKYPLGQKLINLLNKISTLLDEVYEIAPKKQIQMPDELLA